MTNFLVVDWDYFFPNPVEAGTFTGQWHLYDWSHAESSFYINTIWASRLLAFVMAETELPRAVAPEGGWKAWWDRFTIEPDIPLIICDSNAWAGLERDPEDGSAFESVWLYDAHHDSGYPPAVWPPESRFFECEDWMLQHAAAGTSFENLHVRYPTWRVNAMHEPTPPIYVDRAFDDGSSPPVKFHTVLLCRSGAWVPPWCDDQFMELVDAFPGPAEQVDKNVDLVREFDIEAVRVQATYLNEQMAEFTEQNAHLFGKNDLMDS